MTPKYTWVITAVNAEVMDNAREVGTSGPRGATEEQVAKAKTSGVDFRMLGTSRRRAEEAMTQSFYVVVHFAVDSAPRYVACFEVANSNDYLPARDRATRRALEYTGADARGVWIEYPNGDRKRID